VYAIGVVFYELLTGQLPFTADTHTALAIKHMYEAPPRPTRINAAIPFPLEQIVLKVLSKEPSNRYRTADQLGRILSAFRQRSMESTGPMPPLPAEALNVPTFEQTTQIYTRPADSAAKEGARVYPPSSEAETMIHEYTASTRRSDTPTMLHHPQAAVSAHPEAEILQVQSTPKQGERDWVAISLGILALVALLGLIPLWLFVYLAYTQ
jgi:serine/threonine-protein kinase